MLVLVEQKSLLNWRQNRVDSYFTFLLHLSLYTYVDMYLFEIGVYPSPLKTVKKSF